MDGCRWEEGPYHHYHHHHHHQTHHLSEDVVGHVAGVAAEGVGGGVGEDDGRAGHSQGVTHRLLRHVGEVHQHPQAVHLQHYLLRGERRGGERGREGARVRGKEEKTERKYIERGRKSE